MGARLHVIHMKHVAQSRKNFTVEEDVPSSPQDHTSNRGQVMKRKARAMQERRASRVEALRTQVRAGTYRVDTNVLAQRILENTTHFMESNQE